MALYEYYCPDCQTTFDSLRPMSKADEVIACKHCQSERPTRMLSLFAAHSGSGSTEDSPGWSMAGQSGGCCGGACGCSH